MKDQKPPYRHRSLWHMVLAPTVWAFHFVFCYAVMSVACIKLGAPDIARLGVAALTVIALGIIGFLGWRAWVQWNFRPGDNYKHDRPTESQRREFLGHGGFLLSIVSAVGVIFDALPIFIIESCI
ncbi:hypothetical protein [Roseovarius sp. E0-M6]|uniref:hypothetical protein n=1 Tax=Roseovarius sp. E0-M6 TaxID=3127118 RepID=UPI00300FE837